MKYFIRNLCIISAIFSTNSFANKINFCTITINTSDEAKAFEEGIPKEDRKDFNFIELTQHLDKELLKAGRPLKDAYYTDWLGQVCNRFNREKISCDVLLISGHFAGEVFYGIKDQKDKRLRTKHLIEKMCDKSCDRILKEPSIIFLFAGNSLHDQKGANLRDRNTFYNRINKVIGSGAAQRLVEAKYGPYGKAYDDQIRRVFHNRAKIYGFDDKGVSGKSAAKRIKSYLKGLKSFKESFFKGAYKRRHSPDISEEVLSYTKALDDSFIQSFASVGGVVCESVSEDSSSVEGSFDDLTNKICKIKDDSDLNVNRMKVISQLLEKSRESNDQNIAYTIFPWIEEFFRENPPKFDIEQAPYYESGVETTAIKSLKDKKPAFFDEFIFKTKSGYPKLQLLSVGLYLGWTSREDFEKQALKILKTELLATKQYIDRDTFDLICQLAPAIAQIFQKDKFLGELQSQLGIRMTIKESDGSVKRESITLKACFEKELKK